MLSIPWQIVSKKKLNEIVDNRVNSILEDYKDFFNRANEGIENSDPFLREFIELGEFHEKRKETSVNKYDPSTLSSGMLPNSEFEDTLREAKVNNSRAAYIYDPFAKRQVNNAVGNMVGRGLSISSIHDDVQTIIDEFIYDDRNHWPIFLRTSAITYKVDGELVWLVFTDRRTGESWVRARPKSEFKAIYDTNDRMRIVGWIRTWNEVEFDQEGNPMEGAEKQATIVPGDSVPPEMQSGNLGGSNVVIEVIHVYAPGIVGLPEGEGDLNCIIPYIQYLRKAMKYRIVNLISRSAFSWFVSVPNADQAKCDSMKATWKQFPAPGNTVFHNDKMVWEAKSPNINADDALPDIRELKLAIGPVNTGQTEFMTTGDASNANYSSTETHTSAWKISNDENQELWRYWMMRLLKIVVINKSKYATEYKTLLDKKFMVNVDIPGMPKGPKPLDKAISIKFPRIPGRDPLKEAQSAQIRRHMGMASTQILCEEWGYDWDMIKAQLEDEKEFINMINTLNQPQVADGGGNNGPQPQTNDPGVPKMTKGKGNNDN